MELLELKQVSALVGGAAITYTQLLTRNAYINVHLNDGLSTIVAQGNIGSNVGGRSKTYSVTANGTSSYVLTAKGLTNSNPNFTFKRYLHF
jgi:hypothetical protein